MICIIALGRMYSVGRHKHFFKYVKKKNWFFFFFFFSYFYSSPALHNMLGKDDFIIDSKILGDGAYAKVYSGLRKRDKEPVAIKVMDKAQCNSSSFVNIQLEIEIMSALNHPNIVNMQASWETDHETYVVLDYCRGGELFKYMKKYDLSHMPEVAPQFVGEIVLALEYLRKLKVFTLFFFFFFFFSLPSIFKKGRRETKNQKKTNIRYFTET